jgi:hypothetical protein
MGHFNVLKGAYPSLKQLDKTLPLGTGGSGIVRGSCMVVDSNAFRPAVDADAGSVTVNGGIVYFALQNAGDPDVQMANGITGLPCIMPMEVETDCYDASANLALGEFLMVKTGAALQAGFGILTKHTANKTAVGVCTKAAYTRWSNNAVAVAGIKTGNKISVISFWTMYAPNLVVA